MKASFPIIILIFLASCTTSKPKSDLPLVSVSILPQLYLLEQIAGDLVEVNVMVPPGASPASYDPTVNQLVKLEQSELYLKAGYLGFELGWMEKISAQNPDMKVVDLSSGLSLIEPGHKHEHRDEHGEKHHHRGIDPHVWMSPSNMLAMAATLSEALLELLPQDSLFIRQNTLHFQSKMDSLDRVIKGMLEDVEHTTFLIYHPALAYFARDYGLEQESLEFEGKEPSPAQIRALSDLGKQKGIETVFIQKQFDRSNAEVLAREIGARVVQIDPLDPLWEEQILHIATVLKGLQP